MLIFEDNKDAIPIELVSSEILESWRSNQNENTLGWMVRTQFEGKANQHFFVPTTSGHPERVVAGIGERPSVTSIGDLPINLPPGNYRLNDADKAIILGWGLGAYQFAEYKDMRVLPRLFVGHDMPDVTAELNAIRLCRDLINTPTSDMLPHHLEGAARKVATRHDATMDVTTGDDLLVRGLNIIHAVGRASSSAPRLIDMRWGDPSSPAITLVGKGVCFDSGGLDLKSHGNMRLMKKDMGGAATVLGLADLIMSRGLPLRIRVLIPAVENAVSANAFRPGDVLHSYLGLTVEIDNTDAEGRLILCDALALAAEENPAMIIDYATLTGAARSALGTELPAMFSNSDDLAQAVIDSALSVEDPVWRMPLYSDYRMLLKSKIADIVNSANSPYGGAITAALFLERFVGEVPWLHFDIMGWNLRKRPAHPEGGEAMALRAMFEFLQRRYTGD
ncbi:MAG TPA: leucyl aminopeptidase [Gammaproteobacteria bacterium]|uniref:Cytosol aminopeptidase domain-containing protein n=1 Tax=marine metagenome TaxID=408172 RepID=A0A381Y7I1_9ZZZZ|nr:leucyl aminopeptidase [Gammaproteobacteria bacterium]